MAVKQKEPRFSKLKITQEMAKCKKFNKIQFLPFCQKNWQFEKFELEKSEFIFYFIF